MSRMTMHVIGLTCEYKENPLGIDVLRPRLSWKLVSDRRGARQSAYQIVAAGSEEALQTETGLLWDSGKVESDQSVHVPYAGPELESGQQMYWRVRVWDELGEATAYSQSAWWEMGLLKAADWQAQWIGARLVGGKYTAIPAPFLRKEIEVAKPVAKARLYASALGLYEVYLNGARVGEDVFTPGWTEYARRVQYQVYDVTDALGEGVNAWGAILGDGWYCGYVGWQHRQLYGDRPKFCAQLVVTYTDGSEEVFATDGRWKYAFGPILEADMQMGESYDARLEMDGWSETGFSDVAWQPVQMFEKPGIELVATNGPTVRRIETLEPVAEPVKVELRRETCWLFDFGQNMVGRVRLQIEGKAGTTIILRHGEMLDAEGNLYTENLRRAKATDLYTLRGDGLEVYEPHFTFHGFRYVEVRGYSGKPPRDLLTGIVLHSDIIPTGDFECSEPLLNQLQHNIRWGQKGNFLEVPTDCPQRDERLGWTGDAQVFVRTAAFNMQVGGFFTKWQQDLADAQTAAGAFPVTAPLTDKGRDDGGPAWSDAGVVCPWTIYQCYGDERLLERYYDSMVAYMDYLATTSKDYIRCHPALDVWHGFGDWLSINAETPKDLIGTAFYAYSAQLMALIAEILGKTEHVQKYAQLREDIKQAFIERFVSADGVVAGETQTAYVLALYFDLLPEELRSAVLAALVADIEQRDMHLSTGFVGAPYLLHTLSENGRLDVAYQLLKQKTWPSWLYSVTQGATTIWERWDGWTEENGFQDPAMNSFNHYAYGSVGHWLYSVVAGIEIDPAQPGYKHIILRPRPGGGLSHAKASLESPYGRIESAWKDPGDDFRWTINVPPNTTATVYVPAPEGVQVQESGEPIGKIAGVDFIGYENGAAVYLLPSGRYTFTYAYPA